LRSWRCPAAAFGTLTERQPHHNHNPPCLIQNFAPVHVNGKCSGGEANGIAKWGSWAMDNVKSQPKGFATADAKLCRLNKNPHNIFEFTC
jgi:hypothetical protein